MPHRLVLFCVFLLLAGSGSASAEIYRCQTPSGILVISDNSREVDLICETAAKTFRFLNRFNLYAERPITVRMVKQLISSSGGSVYGSYDPYQDTVLLMRYAAISNLPKVYTVFSETFDEADYAGLIAHELAHAVVQHHLQIEPSALAHEYVVAQEYLAYAAQVAVLPEKRRQTLIEDLDIEPWQPGNVISAYYMAFAPHKFGVKSYLHLMAMEDPRAFISLLLETPGLEIYVP